MDKAYCRYGWGLSGRPQTPSGSFFIFLLLFKVLYAVYLNALVIVGVDYLAEDVIIK